MSSSSKYESLMNELHLLEKQVYMYVQKHQTVLASYNELLKKHKLLEKENETLKQQIEQQGTEAQVPEKELKLFDGKSLNSKERENLKKKINELIEKLDFHLRS